MARGLSSMLLNGIAINFASARIAIDGQPFSIKEFMNRIKE